jgi:Xaa-Pro aminopeptidase/Xaa-Pro dipeptidase
MQQRNKLKQSRIGNIQKKLDDFNTDCLIFFNMSNIRYFSGFTGSDGILIIDSNNATLLVDGRYATQAKLETKNIQICEYTDKLAGIVNIVKTSGAKYIGFEALTLTVYIYNE